MGSISEAYYIPVALGLSQLLIPVSGASIGVGVGSWSGYVEFSDPTSLLLEIELGMLKNGVVGLYKGETIAWSNSISSLFLKGVVAPPMGIIQGTVLGSASASNPLKLLKVV